ncbi:MAG: protoporphyrinogen oxidase [Bacteroidota bacterium]
MKEVVIIGAGITGLATALHLKKRGVGFIMLDQACRTGGVIHTVTENGYTYEEGPNSGIIGNVEVLRLFNELKGECELEEASASNKKRYVLKGGKWHALPGGLFSAIGTPLFSLKDKFKVLSEPFRKAGKNPHETLADLVKRRLGKSFLDYAVDPFIIGIYAGDPDRLIPKYALPKLYYLEQNYGSFIKGTIKKAKEPKTEEEKRVTRGVFSVKGGFSNLIKALENKIEKKNIMLGISNLIVLPVEKHFLISYTNQEGVHVEREAKKIISTIGAYNIEFFFPFVSHENISKINALHYTKVIEVAIGFDKWQGMKLDAFGGLIPFKEKRDILGILFMSALFEGKAPESGALFSVFLGGVRRPEIYNMNDNKIKEILEREFRGLMQINEFKPDLLKIMRHEWAIPQYEVDSPRRFEAVAEIEKQFPGLIIGGNLRNGIGMADRILQARMLADSV